MQPVGKVVKVVHNFESFFSNVNNYVRCSIPVLERVVTWLYIDCVTWTGLIEVPREVEYNGKNID